MGAELVSFPKSWISKNHIAFAVLIAAFLISRIAFFSQSPLEWDSVNYALGVECFSIANHQPHAPGSIFYIHLTRAANVLVGNTIRAILLVNLAFGLIGLVAVFHIVRSLGGSSSAAHIAAFLYAANPLVWYYGLVAEVYSIEAAFSALNAWLLLRFIRSGMEYDLLIATLALGLTGGFRTNVTVFFVPVWLTVVLIHRLKKYKLSTIRYPLLLAAATAVWCIPTVVHTGGLSQYRQISQDTIRHFFEIQSVLFGAMPSDHARMILRLGAWYVIGAGVPTMGALVLLCMRPSVWKENKHTAFLALWLGPATLFYILVLAAKPGYLLFVLPGVFVIIGLITTRFFTSSLHGRAAWVFVALVSLPGLGYFFAPGLGAADVPSQLEGTSLQRFFRFTLDEIRYQDALNLAFWDLLADRVDPEHSIFVFSNYSTWNFRIANYYFPEVEQHLLIAFKDGRVGARVPFVSGRLENANSETVDIHGRETYVFFHELSSWGRDLLAQGIQQRAGMHEARCFYIPAETCEDAHPATNRPPWN